MKPALKSALAAVFVLALTGCAHVEAWERGNLAKPQMTSPVNAQQRLALDHIFDSREAASGGAATSGGGCGCY